MYQVLRGFCVHPVREEGEIECVWLREPGGHLGKSDLYLTTEGLPRTKQILLLWCVMFRVSARRSEASGFL